jgi:hypothetical protein
LLQSLGNPGILILDLDKMLAKSSKLMRFRQRLQLSTEVHEMPGTDYATQAQEAMGKDTAGHAISNVQGSLELGKSVRTLHKKVVDQIANERGLLGIREEIPPALKLCWVKRLVWHRPSPVCLESGMSSAASADVHSSQNHMPP